MSGIVFLEVCVHVGDVDAAVGLFRSPFGIDTVHLVAFVLLLKGFLGCHHDELIGDGCNAQHCSLVLVVRACAEVFVGSCWTWDVDALK